MRSRFHLATAIGFSCCILVVGGGGCTPIAGDCQTTNTCDRPPRDWAAHPMDSADSPTAPDPIFVSREGDDRSPGTLKQPVRTLSKALEMANRGPMRVYACAEEFHESVTIPSGIALYGGYDCAAGEPSDQPTVVMGASDQIPLRLKEGPAPTRIVDIEVRAADASKPGGSSIAVIIGDVEAELIHCSFIAGAAQDGTKGVGGGAPPGQAPNGVQGSALGAPSDDIQGGANKQYACDGVPTTGGNGGSGGYIFNGSTQSPSVGNPGKGPKGGGVGGPIVYGMGSCAKDDKQPGLAGDHGDAGLGGGKDTNAAAPTLDFTAGYVGQSGQSGTKGHPGDGGGGGGGREAGNFDSNGATTENGASGGSGGAGGCGGKGGGPGQPGGSSIALVRLGARLIMFDAVILQAGRAGNGGDGGEGQDGQPGGDGGLGGKGIGQQNVYPGCSGGKGGQGGRGGYGGGGAGGYSLGIASAVDPMSFITPSDLDKLDINFSNETGTGGLGDPGDTNSAGLNGLSATMAQLGQ